MRSLPAERGKTARSTDRVDSRKAPQRRALSRRRAKQLAQVGQWWEHVDSGEAWRIRQLHRGDGGRNGSVAARLAPVELERPGHGRRYLTFGELGSQYQLVEDLGEWRSDA